LTFQFVVGAGVGGTTVIWKVLGGLVKPRKLRVNVAVVVRAPESASAAAVCKHGALSITQTTSSP
jgi:hypothetical protein